MNKHFVFRVIIKHHRTLRVKNQIVATAKNSVAASLFQGWNLVQIIWNRLSAIHRQCTASIAENARFGWIFESYFPQLIVCEAVNT